MIKNILVPLSGGPADASILATALNIARATSAHLDVFHVRLSDAEAVLRAPHVDFCPGPALADAFRELRRREARAAAAVAEHFVQFCSVNHIPVVAAAAAPAAVSAALVEETDDIESRLLARARHSDLTVVGRGRLIEELLMHSGRPLVIAPDAVRTSPSGAVVVGWTESAPASRALRAAMPLLQSAKRVVLFTSAADPAHAAVPLERLASRLARQGVRAETLPVAAASGPPAAALLDTAAHIDADLVVVGGYGHSPLRESLFGGVTRTLIEGTAVPVFMMH